MGSRKSHRRLNALLVLNAALLMGCQSGGSGNQPGDAPQPPAPRAAAAPPRVIIREPRDGAELAVGPVRIVLSAENIQLAPAGEDRAGTGHLHLFINQPVTDIGVAIPAGAEGIVHLGQAQTSHELTALRPGEYTVIAVLGDFAHRTIAQTTDTVRFRVR